MNFSPIKYKFEYELLAWQEKVYESASVIYAGISIGTLTKFSNKNTGYFYIATIFGEARKFKLNQKKYIAEFVNSKIQIHEWAIVSEMKRRTYKFKPISGFTILE